MYYEVHKNMVHKFFILLLLFIFLLFMFLEHNINCMNIILQLIIPRLAFLIQFIFLRHISVAVYDKDPFIFFFHYCSILKENSRKIVILFFGEVLMLYFLSISDFD